MGRRGREQREQDEGGGEEGGGSAGWTNGRRVEEGRHGHQQTAAAKLPALGLLLPVQQCCITSAPNRGSATSAQAGTAAGHHSLAHEVLAAPRELGGEEAGAVALDEPEN